MKQIVTTLTLIFTRTTAKSVFSLVDSAVNMTLPAFAAERRAAAPFAAERRRPTLPICISCPPSAGNRCCCRSMGLTDGRWTVT